MAGEKCSHNVRIIGVLECDLSRSAGQNSAYAARFEVCICEECGQVEIYCKSHKSACDWLNPPRTDLKLM